jgi:hypothetical protein
MKKLFAGIVAALALVPVIAKAATYTAGEYINFAGNDTDWATLKTAGSAEAIQQALNGTGVGTVYVGETSHKDSKGNAYLKVISLYGIPGDSNSIIAQASDSMTTSGAYSEAVTAIRAHVKSEYCYDSATDGVDVGIATLADVTAAFGVSTANATIELTDNAKNLFRLMTAASTGTCYVFTNTLVSGSTYWAIEVTKANDVVTGLKLVQKDAANTGAWAFILPTLEMNSAYVCGSTTEDTYSCYECTKDDGSEYVWAIDGSQADTCKKLTKITSKAKCVKSPKTGVDSYLIPSAIVLGVCAIVLTVVKRKDAFKAI